jgi:FkbM family methyltransferase
MTAALNPAALHEDLVFDVGLHRGQDTEFYLKKGFRVVAFEANPELARTCRERFAEAISQGRLVIVEGAIVAPGAATSGSVKFWLNESMDIWGTADPGWADRNARLGTRSRAIDVPAVDFSRALREHGVPRYMKIDIEGCDLVCLRALQEFRHRPRYLSMESDKTSLDAVRAELSLLEELGYDAFQIVEQSSIPRRQRQPAPAREGVATEHRFERGCSGLFGLELPGRWRSRSGAISRYRWIRLGYALLGDDGVLTRTGLPGERLVRLACKVMLGLVTRAPVPGWYDTHARHREQTP